MSNQRPGKMKRAALVGPGDSMLTVKFFKYAAKVLEDKGEEDAAFYFEQVEDWLRSGKPLSADEKMIKSIFGM